MVLHNTSGGFSTTTTVGELVAARTPRPFSESLVAYGTMSSQSCGPSAATRGSGAHRCRWTMGPDRWADRACGGGDACGSGNRDRRDALPGGWDQLAVVEAAGTYAVHGGLIGDRTITSFEKIASGPIHRAGRRRCPQVLRTSSVIDVHGRFVVHAARRLQSWAQVGERGGVVSGTRTDPVGRGD